MVRRTSTLVAVFALFIAVTGAAPAEASAKKCNYNFAGGNGVACLQLTGSGLHVDNVRTDRQIWVWNIVCDYDSYVKFSHSGGTTIHGAPFHGGCNWWWLAYFDFPSAAGYWPDPTDVRGYWSDTLTAGFEYIRKVTIHA